MSTDADGPERKGRRDAKEEQFRRPTAASMPRDPGGAAGLDHTLSTLPANDRYTARRLSTSERVTLDATPRSLRDGGARIPLRTSPYALSKDE